MEIDIGEVAAPRSFIFLWCGSSDGLDLGRICLRRWGFRRCEDICWIKTNADAPGHSKNLEPKAVFQRTKVKKELIHSKARISKIFVTSCTIYINLNKKNQESFWMKLVSPLMYTTAQKILSQCFGAPKNPVKFHKELLHHMMNHLK